MVSFIVKHFFELMILLIIVVYFVGVSTEANVFSNAAVRLIYAGTGRDASGQFANYPKVQ